MCGGLVVGFVAGGCFVDNLGVLEELLNGHTAKLDNFITTNERANLEHVGFDELLGCFKNFVLAIEVTSKVNVLVHRLSVDNIKAKDGGAGGGECAGYDGCFHVIYLSDFVSVICLIGAWVINPYRRPNMGVSTLEVIGNVCKFSVPTVCANIGEAIFIKRNIEKPMGTAVFLYITLKGFVLWEALTKEVEVGFLFHLFFILSVYVSIVTDREKGCKRGISYSKRGCYRSRL